MTACSGLPQNVRLSERLGVAFVPPEILKYWIEFVNARRRLGDLDRI